MTNPTHPSTPRALAEATFTALKMLIDSKLAPLIRRLDDVEDLVTKPQHRTEDENDRRK